MGELTNDLARARSDILPDQITFLHPIKKPQNHGF
jgi:hypothetical protein